LSKKAAVLKTAVFFSLTRKGRNGEMVDFPGTARARKPEAVPFSARKQTAWRVPEGVTAMTRETA